MSSRALVAAALGVAVLALVVLLAGGADTEEVKVELASANGLRSGSDVKVGGVKVGEIGSIDLRRGDVLEATLVVDPEKTPAIRSDARAEIVTGNLLGSKYLTLDPGRTGREQEEGRARIAAGRVTQPTDLDQVLSVLDSDTRARFQVLVNELGLAVTGKKKEFSRTFEILPQDLDRLNRLVRELASDNTTLADLVRTSGSYVTTLAKKRRELLRAIDELGKTTEITTAKRAQLVQSLDAAPAALRSAQRFLTELEQTTKPLQPAARAISATAPALTDTLAELRPFERAAKPALDKAVDVSPTLTRLSTVATPVLREANPTLASLITAARAMQPASKVLRVSIDDTLGTLEGWARAIQGRDGASHVFRGRATLTAEMMRTLVDAYKATANPVAEPTTKRRSERKPAQPQTSTPSTPTTPAPAKARNPVDDVKDALQDTLDGVLPKDLLPKLGGLLNGRSDQQAPKDGVDQGLLDFLLGR